MHNTDLPAWACDRWRLAGGTNTGGGGVYSNEGGSLHVPVFFLFLPEEYTFTFK